MKIKRFNNLNESLSKDIKVCLVFDGRGEYYMKMFYNYEDVMNYIYNLLYMEINEYKKEFTGENGDLSEAYKVLSKKYDNFRNLIHDYENIWGYGYSINVYLFDEVDYEKDVKLNKNVELMQKSKKYNI